MSSINPHYTFTYSQPEEYRFSHDSVFMARAAFEWAGERDLREWEILDLCAGCGVIGLDFLFHLRTAGRTLPARVDFLDVQSVYEAHFAINARAVPEASTRFLCANYSELLNGSRRYDLILCNPPYFRAGQGGMSPSEFKNRCRFFLDSDFPTLLNAIVASLKPDGRALVLLRDLRDHGWDVESEARAVLAGRAELARVGDVRGTGLVELRLR